MVGLFLQMLANYRNQLGHKAGSKFKGISWVFLFLSVNQGKNFRFACQKFLQAFICNPHLLPVHCNLNPISECLP